MAWRLAKSLETLRSQLNEEYPDRNKASDGTIGDAAHQAVPSDHNPNSASVVCALDITHDAPYFDAHRMCDNILARRHPDLKYIISNRRIAGFWTNWQWTRYGGSDPHDTHVHISVGVGPDGQSKPPYDDTDKWNIGGVMAEKADLATARILTHGILGSNGVAGRKTSLDGSRDSDLLKNHVGRELTNAYIQELFTSPEGVNWRDKDDGTPSSSSIPGINRRLNEATDLVRKLEIAQAASPLSSDASKWQTLKALVKALIN